MSNSTQQWYEIQPLACLFLPFPYATHIYCLVYPILAQGTVEFELYWDHAPKSCANIVGLTKKGYYDGVIFHRIIKVWYALQCNPNRSHTLSIATNRTL